MVFKSLRLLESSRWSLTLAGEPLSHAESFLHHRGAGGERCVGDSARSDSFTSHMQDCQNEEEQRTLVSSTQGADGAWGRTEGRPLSQQNA